MKYIMKQQLPVDVVQWTGRNEVEVYNFLENKNVESSREVKLSGNNFIIRFDGAVTQGLLYLKDYEGISLVERGNYIIKNDKGYFRCCKPDTFKAMYDLYGDKTAEKMFDVINFKKIKDDEYDVQYTGKYRGAIVSVVFFKKNKELTVSDYEGGTFIMIGSDLYRPITKQIEELGWNQ